MTKNQMLVNVREFGGNVAAISGDVAETLVRKTGGVAGEFRKFIARGNVIDTAVGIVMGTAFTNIVNSIIKDLITPIVGLATHSQLEESYFVLRCPDNYKNCRSDPTYAKTTREEAQRLGVVTENYGNFLQLTINFFIISFLMFVLVKFVGHVYRPLKIEAKKSCPFCVQKVPVAATRCAFCTSHIPAPHSAELVD